MNIKFLKAGLFLLLPFFIGAGCEKIELADESIVVDNKPGLSIYKTSNDYFNYISFKLTLEGMPNAVRGFDLNDPRISVGEDGKIEPNFRWRLKSGYIVDSETTIDEIFTDITIEEYVNYVTYNTGGWPDELLLSRIIDKNPYTEFYWVKGLDKPKIEFTLGDLNEMLENGTIEEHFTRLK